MAKQRVGVEYSPSMLEPVRPAAVSPDRALCLPTFSHFVIVNKVSLCLSEPPPPLPPPCFPLSLSPPISSRRGGLIYLPHFPCLSLNEDSSSTVLRRILLPPRKGLDSVEVTELSNNKQVVISRAFFLFFPCNHIINIKKKFFFRRSKIQRNFSLLVFASQES
jgi:hypothetical protein